ncbi:hypothetical protein OG394_26540 [Kribbella sp. NBC_01245]|uniref:hypothetical protein n=1 Tax=Kribbella sp. NBC_01245 TaxID=2903578 RepID=UPI002E2A9385|nr:hypothetical protein [Kribbella sp. NBC_01245]
MAYDEFRTEYDAVLEACLSARLDMDGLAVELDRLRGIAAALSPDEQTQAATDLQSLDEILTMARQTPYSDSPAYNEANRVFGLANSDDGTPAERIARAEEGIQQLRAIADRGADQQENYAIMRLTEPLAMLIDALRTAPPGVR